MPTTQHRIYLSGPMRGRVDNNHPAFFEAESVVRFFYPDSQIFNPARQFDGDTSLPMRTYLQHDLAFLLTRCDMIVMLPEWRSSQGARLEYALGRMMDLDIVGLEWSVPGSLMKFSSVETNDLNNPLTHPYVEVWF